MQSEDVESWFRGKPTLPTHISEPAIQREDMHTQIACLSRADLETLVLVLADKLPEVRWALEETYENSLEAEPKKRPKSQMTTEALEALCRKYQR